MSGSKSLSSYDYACIRVVPRVEHEEFINAGVILFCRTQRFLGATVWLDEARVRALCPQIDLDEVRQQLEVIVAMCKGAGPVAAAGIADTFHWLVAPHSTVIQCSAVHSGLCHDPKAALDALAAKIRPNAPSLFSS